jgi:DNA-directed RNA polymerase sigma subunit (sigma70/sigma32)
MVRSVHEQLRCMANTKHLSDEMARIMRAMHDVEQETQAEADRGVVADRLGLSEENVDRAVQSLAMANFDDFDESTIVSTETSRDAKDSLEQVSSGQMNERINEALELLSDLEREVITMHYGLDGGGVRSFSYIAQRKGISPQGVKDIVRRGLGRLKLCSISLRDWAEISIAAKQERLRWEPLEKAQIVAFPQITRTNQEYESTLQEWLDQVADACGIPSEILHQSTQNHVASIL